MVWWNRVGFFLQWTATVWLGTAKSYRGGGGAAYMGVLSPWMIDSRFWLLPRPPPSDLQVLSTAWQWDSNVSQQNGLLNAVSLSLSLSVRLSLSHSFSLWPFFALHLSRRCLLRILSQKKKALAHTPTLTWTHSHPPPPTHTHTHTFTQAAAKLCFPALPEDLKSIHHLQKDSGIKEAGGIRLRQKAPEICSMRAEAQDNDEISQHFAGWMLVMNEQRFIKGSASLGAGQACVP